ncbi:MAG: peptidylprolyl isomerase [Clostridia bacterium]|nr:peptidylprolyl isomerase [Clostridia bacterium]
MMNKRFNRGMLAWLCALLMLVLPVGAAAQEAADDPVVVRVGEFTYTQSQLQGSLDSLLELSQMLRGDAPSEEEKQARLQATVDSFVGLGVIENKLSEAGKNSFTDAELEDINQTARSKYEELWQVLYQQMQKSDSSVTEAAVTAQLEGMGYTFDAIYDEIVLQTRQNRAIELFCQDVILKQSQVDAYYEEQFVAPDRDAYEGNIDRFDQEILMNNNEAFYIPEGYRYIRQIVLEIPQAAMDAVASEKVRFNRAAQAMTTALQNLTMAATEASDWSDDLAAAKTGYDEASKALQEAQSDYQAALKAATLPLMQEQVDEIREQYAAGIDFKSLVNRYSIDKTERNISGEGYLFHPDSQQWPEDFKNAAAALSAPGDISDPVVTEQGVHIICYEGDVPAGEHVLTDDEKQLLNAAALRYYQLEKLNGLVEEWQAEYEIETHPELLKY